jgi:SAM-dependent methyltransferase
MPGWINCDVHPAPNVDAAFDVEKTWPFASSTVSDIYASHLLEHLADYGAFFGEAWRVLQPNGTLTLRVPYGGHKAAWWDLTHVRPWFAESFCALQPGYSEAIGNPQTASWRAFFGVQVDLRVSGKFARLLRWRAFRRWFCAFADHIPNAIEELYAYCYALKEPEAVAVYGREHPGHCIGCRLVIYRHHMTGDGYTPRPLAEALLPLADLDLVNGFHAWHW